MKTILITGGTSGIGKATALLAARKGWKVCIAGRNEERGRDALQEIKTITENAWYYPLDISSAKEVEAVVSRIAADRGQLDYAVNSAATDEGIGVPLADIEEADFDRQIAINLKGAWLCMKYQIRQMLKQGKGSIVNVSSINGLGGARGGSVYSAAKSGMIGLTKSAAQEYATSGIRINVLCAGAFDTPMLQRVFDKANPENPSSVKQAYESMIPMNRVADPSEAAAAILWMLGEDASYLTGHSLVLDGGTSSSFR